MTTRVSLRVRAVDLQPGDRITQMRPDRHIELEDALHDKYYDPGWRVLDPPVKIVLTGDVAIHLGVRERDREHGVNIRMPAAEEVSVLRDVRT